MCNPCKWALGEEEGQPCGSKQPSHVDSLIGDGAERLARAGSSVVGELASY